MVGKLEMVGATVPGVMVGLGVVTQMVEYESEYEYESE